MASPVELRTHSIWIEDDGIVRVKVKPHIQIDLQDAKASVSAISGMCGGKARPVLINMTELMAMDRDARHFFASEMGATVAVAAALLISSPLSRAIGNFFMGLNKPVIPTRLFTSETEALAWLEGFLR